MREAKGKSEAGPTGAAAVLAICDLGTCCQADLGARKRLARTGSLVALRRSHRDSALVCGSTCARARRALAKRGAPVDGTRPTPEAVVMDTFATRDEAVSAQMLPSNSPNMEIQTPWTYPNFS